MGLISFLGNSRLAEDREKGNSYRYDTLCRAIRRQMKPEVIGTGEKTRLRSTAFETLPKIFNVHLQRSGFSEGFATRRISALPYPKTLVLQTYKHHKSFYELKALVVHSGGLSTQSGHFFTLAKTDNHGWVNFNDHKVYRDSPRKYYGGSECAYLLFYVKIAEITESDMPRKLQDRAIMAYNKVQKREAIKYKTLHVSQLLISMVKSSKNWFVFGGAAFSSSIWRGTMPSCFLLLLMSFLHRNRLLSLVQERRHELSCLPETESSWLV